MKTLMGWLSLSTLAAVAGCLTIHVEVPACRCAAQSACGCGEAESADVDSSSEAAAGLVAPASCGPVECRAPRAQVLLESTDPKDLGVLRGQIIPQLPDNNDE